MIVMFFYYLMGFRNDKIGFDGCCPRARQYIRDRLVKSIQYLSLAEVGMRAPLRYFILFSSRNRSDGLAELSSLTGDASDTLVYQMFLFSLCDERACERGEIKQTRAPSTTQFYIQNLTPNPSGACG
jgi:hypothetical protein